MTIHNHFSYLNPNLTTRQSNSTPDSDPTLDERVRHLHHSRSTQTSPDHDRTTPASEATEFFSHNSFGRFYELGTPLKSQSTEDHKKPHLSELGASPLDTPLTAETCKTPIASTLSPSAQKTVTPQSGFTILHTQSPAEHKKLSSITNIWAATSRARFLNTRDCLTPQNKATKEDSDYDHTQMQDYIEIIRYFQGKGNPGDLSHFLALVDQTQNVQGLAKLTKKSDHLYLNALLTAPWNLPQKGETPTKIQQAISPVKGGGTALVAASCELAKELNLTRLETSPSAGAKPFYTKTLEIPYNPETQTCVLDLTKPLPKRLKQMLPFPKTETPSYEMPPSPFDGSDD